MYVFFYSHKFDIIVVVINMNLGHCVILEIIPTSLKDGDIIQLSALKLNDLILEDRFDYRLNYDLINNGDLVNMISYDKEKFNYLNSTSDIIDNFKNWIGDCKLLIIDNSYTCNYLYDIDNEKESIFKYLGMSYSDDIIDRIVKKYNLESSNYIVDLLYEALIYESNNK